MNRKVFFAKVSKQGNALLVFIPIEAKPNFPPRTAVKVINLEA